MSCTGEGRGRKVQGDDPEKHGVGQWRKSKWVTVLNNVLLKVFFTGSVSTIWFCSMILFFNINDYFTLK